MRLNETADQPILISRLRGQKYPSPIPTLGNLEQYLRKPFEQPQRNGVKTRENPFPVPGPLDPTKRDGLLSYAYSLYDTFVTGESHAGPAGPNPAHAPMLLSLLELLHGLDPSHLQTGLLLGCVYHRQGLYQRALDINRNLLEQYPNNVRHPSCAFTTILLTFSIRSKRCVIWELRSRLWDLLSRPSNFGGKRFALGPHSGMYW